MPDENANVPLPSPAEIVQTLERDGFWHRLTRPYDRWYCFAMVAFVSLLMLSTMNLGQVMSAVVYLTVVAGVTGYLYLQGRAFKEILFHAHVKDSSWLQFFRHRQAGVFIISLIVSIFLTLSLSVFLLTAQWVTVVLVALVPVLYPWIRGFCWSNLSLHLKIRSRVCLTHFLTTAVLGVIMMVAMITAKWIQLTVCINDFILRSSDHMADYVISQVNHSLPWLQHLGRTLCMFELELLRAQQMADGWWGTALLIYFLLPSTLAAFTIPILFSGLYFVFKGSYLPQPDGCR